MTHETHMTQLIARTVALLLLLAPAVGADTPAYRSPVTLVADAAGRIACVSDATANRVAIVDLETGEVLHDVALPAAPGDLLLDGNMLFVADMAAEGQVHVIDVATGTVQRQIAAGHMPRSPLLVDSGETLVVLNRFEDLVRFIDLDTGETTDMIGTAREPIDAVLTPDGSTLVVVDHLPHGPALAEHVAAEVSFIDVPSRRRVGAVKLANGATSVREVCLTPDRRIAFITHIVGRYHNPTTQLARGWINTNAISIVDVDSKTLYATVLLDDVDRGAANPWGIACSDDGTTLAVTHSGTHEVSLIDLPTLIGTLATMQDADRHDVAFELSFLSGMRTRVALPGNNPRGVVFAGSRVVTADYYSGSLSVVQPAVAMVNNASGHAVHAIKLGPDMPMDQVRLGEMYFHDASLCFQNWQSCTSCHPDTRADALNWDLLNDGFGNAKNTKSMLLAHETPPAMVTGIRARAEVAVRAGIRYIQFAVRPEEDLNAIDAYLKSVQPVPSPELVNGQLSPAAERGRAVFRKAQCTACHTGPYFTDMALHDLAMTTG